MPVKQISFLLPVFGRECLDAATFIHTLAFALAFPLASCLALARALVVQPTAALN